MNICLDEAIYNILHKQAPAQRGEICLCRGHGVTVKALSFLLSSSFSSHTLKTKVHCVITVMGGLVSLSVSADVVQSHQQMRNETTLYNLNKAL